MIIGNKMKSIDNLDLQADYYLVGLGEEFQYDWNLFQDDSRYNEIARFVDQNKEYEAIMPYLHKLLINKYPDDLYMRSLEALSTFLENKNYFVVSTGIDDYIWKTRLDANRIVTPCGGFRLLQCDENCENLVYELDNSLLERVEALYNKKIGFSEIKLPTCPKCGKYLTMNQIGVSKYCEEGYLQAWNQYTKWLQGTMNRNVLILELGMGLQFPTVFRWPIEKMVSYNLKSNLIRVHSVLYQIDDGIKQRAKGIKANSKNWIINNIE